MINLHIGFNVLIQRGHALVRTPWLQESSRGVEKKHEEGVWVHGGQRRKSRMGKARNETGFPGWLWALLFLKLGTLWFAPCLSEGQCQPRAFFGTVGRLRRPVLGGGCLCSFLAVSLSSG